MTQLDGDRIGRLLDTLVPELPAHPERLAAIERGVRRRRQRRLAVLAGACAALVLLGAPAVLVPRSSDPVSEHGSIAGDCPPEPPTFSRSNDGLPATGPGVLAPPGAVRATMCQYHGYPGPFGEARTPRELILTRDLASLVTELNKLPTEPNIDPCHALGTGGYLTLEYRDGRRLTIELSVSCGFVRRGTITRHNGWDAVVAFDNRYRAQEIAAARPDTITAAPCPATLTATPDYQFSPKPAGDLWLYDPNRLLAAPYTVVTACRYTHPRNDTLPRLRQVVDRGAATEAGDAVETAYRSRLGRVPVVHCPPSTTVRTVDVLVLRDSVGETVEVRVPRDTCDVVVFGDQTSPKDDALTRVLDRLLGPPR